MDENDVTSSRLHVDSSVSMAMLGFNSTMLLYNTCTMQPLSTEFASTDSSLTHYAVERVFKQLDQQREAMSDINFQYSVNVKCFEVTDAQIRDLLNEDSRSYYTKQKTVLKPRVYQNSNGFKYLGIDGLTSVACSSSSLCIEMMTECIGRRSCLVRGSQADTTRGINQILANPEVMGVVGNVMMEFSIKQMVNNEPSLTKESVLQIVSLAPSDTLSYRSSPSESILCLTQCEISDFYSLQASSSSSFTTSLLNNSLKSLSTLTRVVQTLKANHDAVDKKTTTVKHVPYRDCLLTRLLQHSLHGNCYLSMFTFVGSNNSIDSISRTLRFASDIGGLHNKLFIQSNLLPALNTNKVNVAPVNSITELDDVDDNESDGENEGGELNLPEDSVQTSQFMSLFDMLSSNMNLLASELNRINSDLLTSSLNTIKTRKEYGENKSGLKTANEEEVMGSVEDVVDTGRSTTSEAVAPTSVPIAVTPTGVVVEEALQDVLSAPSPLISEDTTANTSIQPSVLTPLAVDVEDANVSTANDSVSLVIKSKTSSKIHSAIEDSKKLPATSTTVPAGSVKANGRQAKADTGSNGMTKSASAASIQSTPSNGNAAASNTISAKAAMTPRRNSVGATPVTSTVSSNKQQAQKPPKLSTTTAVSSNSSPAVNGEGKSGTNSRRGSQSSKNSGRSDSLDSNNGEHKTSGGSSTLPSVINVPMTESRKTGIELGIFTADGTVDSSDPPPPLAKAASQPVLGTAVLPTVNGGVSAVTVPSSDPAFATPATPEVFVPPKVELITAKDIIRIVHSEPPPDNTSTTGSGSLPAIAPQPGVSAASSSSTSKKDLFVTPRRQKPLPFLDNDSPTAGDDSPSHSFPAVGSNKGATIANDNDGAIDAPVESRRVIRRRKVEENDDDSGGDNLSEMERKFLRACASNQAMAAQKMLAAGVNINVKNNFDRDGMQICARNGSIAMLELLRSWGGDMSSRGPKGDTLFHLAAYNGHVEAMRWLHGKGAVVESVDEVGQTAIHYAARRGEIGVLVYGHEELQLDMFQEDFEGKTPLDCVPVRGVTGIDECKEFLTALTFKMQMIEMLKNRVES